MEVAAALRRGFDRSVSRDGLVFIAGFLLITFLFSGVPSFLFDTGVAASNAFALGVTAAIGMILSLALTVVAFRMFAAYEPAGPDQDYDTSRIGIATVHMVVGSIVAATIIGIGFVLIIPGIFLLVSLLLWPAVVAMEDRDFVDAFRESWRLTSGHRWQVLFLVAGITVVLLMANALAGLFTVLTPGLLVSAFLVSVLNAFFTVFSIAAIADAYTQLAA